MVVLRRFVGMVAGLWLVVLAGCNGSSLSTAADGARPAGDGSIRVPALHRASGSACPTARGAGSVCTLDLGTGPNACLVDSDCTAGTNGRCFSPNGPGGVRCMPTACSYDDCSSDSDCPSRVPCLCRDSAADSNANLCVTGGNCAVDADCGPGGYCSPGGYDDFCSTPVYFCHTPADTCIDNTDCAQSGSRPVLACNYDLRSGHFACSEVCIAPP